MSLHETTAIEMRVCKRCEKPFPADKKHFPQIRRRSGTYALRPFCKPCNNARLYRWRSENHDLVLTTARREHAKLKLAAVTYYSNGANKCACCSESTMIFLCIDHINGGGNAHRRANVEPGSGFHLYRWLKNNNYPPGFQVLCHNCNMAKHLLGTCPHQIEHAERAARKS